MSEDRFPPLDDARFLKNVAWARSCGYDLVCSECGQGIQDETDDHDSFCPQSPDVAAQYRAAARWAAARQRHE